MIHWMVKIKSLTEIFQRRHWERGMSCSVILTTENIVVDSNSSLWDVKHVRVSFGSWGKVVFHGDGSFFERFIEMSERACVSEKCMCKPRVWEAQECSEMRRSARATRIWAGSSRQSPAASRPHAERAGIVVLLCGWAGGRGVRWFENSLFFRKENRKRNDCHRWNMSSRKQVLRPHRGRVARGGARTREGKDGRGAAELFCNSTKYRQQSPEIWWIFVNICRICPLLKFYKHALNVAKMAHTHTYTHVMKNSQ